MHLLPDCNNAHASSAPKVKPQLEVELFHPTKKKPLSYLVCGFYPPTPVPVSTSQRVLWNPQAYTCHFSSLIFSLAS